MEYNEIDIYLKYNQLDTSDLVELLGDLDRLHREIIDPQFYGYRRPFYFPDFFYPYRNVLKIKSIETGQSIRFRFSEGWKPRFRFDKKELEINVPRKLGIPIIILYLLFTGAQKIVELKGELLDNELKKLEIEMKKIEIHRELFEQNENFLRLQRQADKTIEFLQFNNSINYFEINGVKLKDIKEK